MNRFRHIVAHHTATYHIVAGIALAWSAFSISPAWADEISGPVCVTDGDRLSVNATRKSGACQGGTKVRLFGIDAPEIKQLCTHANGRDFRCGLYAASFLLNQLKDKNAICVGEETDAQGQLIAVCKVGAIDVNALMVREGWALASPEANAYIPAQAAAKAFHKGIWQMQFEMPWVWRQTHE